MGERKDFIQLGNSFEMYMDSVARLEKSNDRVIKNFSNLGETLERLAAALHSLSGRDRKTGR